MEVAGSSSDNVLLKNLGNGGLKPYLVEWLQSDGAVSDRSAIMLAQEAHRLMRDKNALKTQLRYRFLALMTALLSGDHRLLDTLAKAMEVAQAQPVVATLEDNLWAKLFIMAPVRTVVEDALQIQLLTCQQLQDVVVCKQTILNPDIAENVVISCTYTFYIYNNKCMACILLLVENHTFDVC